MRRPRVRALPDSAEEEKRSVRISAAERSEGGRASERRRNICEALQLLATAREPVDTFFDKVMVMVEDQRVRANRLALLRTL